MNASFAMLIGLSILPVSASDPTLDPAAANAACVTLTWSAQDTTQMTGGSMNWDYATQFAANYSGEGYSDWRLPTAAEYQAAFQNGTSGQWSPNLSSNWVWTSKGKGVNAVCVKLVTDANGDVLYPQSGQSASYSKSSFIRAKLVRP